MELRTGMFCVVHEDWQYRPSAANYAGMPFCRRFYAEYQLPVPQEACMMERVVLVPTGTLKLKRRHDFTFGDERLVIHDSTYWTDIDGRATAVNRA